MTDVIDFAKHRAARAANGSGFMVCPCNINPSQPDGFHPVADFDAQGMIISALVCASCGQTAHLVAGRVG